MTFSRRDFLASTLAGSAALAISPAAAAEQASPPAASQSGKTDIKRAARLPLMICSEYSYNWLEEGYSALAGGADTLDAALIVVKGPEDDPNYQNVGLGGR